MNMYFLRYWNGNDYRSVDDGWGGQYSVPVFASQFVSAPSKQFLKEAIHAQFPQAAKIQVKLVKKGSK